jgi:HEPN domain-containing protein
MKINDRISFWVDAGNYDLKTAEYLQESGRYVYTVFLRQQAMEKYLKALYIKKTSKEPPRTHNLAHLVSLLELEVTDGQLQLLADLTSYYIEGRYPTYKLKLSRAVAKRKASDVLIRTKETIKWLRSSLKL